MGVRFIKGISNYKYKFSNIRRNVSLLLHMDGTNGSQSFVDSSVNNFTITPYGETQISTSVTKSGFGQSAYFDGDEDYLEINDITEFEFGSENFTLECWINCAEGGGGTVIARWGGSGNPFFFFADVNQGIVIYLNNSFIIGGGTITADTWHHIAMVRNGTTIMAFIDGIQIESIGNLSDPLDSSDVALIIGGDVYGNVRFNGYIDEVRITRGLAIYTQNFTPPIVPFTNSISSTNKYKFL